MRLKNAIIFPPLFPQTNNKYMCKKSFLILKFVLWPSGMYLLDLLSNIRDETSLSSLLLPSIINEEQAAEEELHFAAVKLC